MRKKKQRVRQEHIVPRWYLGNFCDVDGQLHVYERGKLQRRGNPAKECRERDFNEFELNGKKTDKVYEDFLAQLESDAKPVCDVLCTTGILTTEEVNNWAVFVSSLLLRTRKTREQMSAHTIRQLQTEEEKHRFALHAQLNMAIEGRFLPYDDIRPSVDRVIGSAHLNLPYYHLTQMPGGILTLANALLAAEWKIIGAPEGHIFVTSDAPVSTMEVQPNRNIIFGSGLGRDNVAVFLPLNTKKVFMAHQKGWPMRGPFDVELINTATIQFGHRNVYASYWSAELQVRVDTGLNSIVFGENAFRTAGGN
jgi:Protein of unknown function (DUF4238)